jgi:hypothetical protein
VYRPKNTNLLDPTVWRMSGWLPRSSPTQNSSPNIYLVILPHYFILPAHNKSISRWKRSKESFSLKSFGNSIRIQRVERSPPWTNQLNVICFWVESTNLQLFKHSAVFKIKVAPIRQRLFRPLIESLQSTRQIELAVAMCQRPVQMINQSQHNDVSYYVHCTHVMVYFAKMLSADN